MHVLTDPNELETLPLPEAALLELHLQLAIPGHDIQELWKTLPARLIYFDEDDPTEMLLLALMPPPEFEVTVNESLLLRLYVVNDYGAGLYLLSHTMQHNEIVKRLSQIHTSEVIFTVTMETVMSAIAGRLGEEALNLSPEELKLAREEVQIAIDHNLDIRDYVNMGLDSWQVIRTMRK